MEFPNRREDTGYCIYNSFANRYSKPNVWKPDEYIDPIDSKRVWFGDQLFDFNNNRESKFAGQILIFKIVNHPFFWVARCDPHRLVMVMHLALLQGPPEPKQEVPESFAEDSRLV